MKFFSKKISTYAPIIRLKGFAAVSLLLLFTAGGCGSGGSVFQEIGDSANPVADDDDNGGLKSLNELVINQCQTSPENTAPVSLGGLAFTDPRPENSRPGDSDTTAACISGS